MTLTDKYRAELLALVDRYKAVCGKADSGVSFSSFPSDGEFISRLRRGQNVTLYKAARLEEHIENELEKARREVEAGNREAPVGDGVGASRKNPGQCPSSGGPKESRPFSDDNGTEYWQGRLRQIDYF
jgi:hypothetical protein